MSSSLLSEGVLNTADPSPTLLCRSAEEDYKRESSMDVAGGAVPVERLRRVKLGLFS
jgi:hypothetical protein